MNGRTLRLRDGAAVYSVKIIAGDRTMAWGRYGSPARALAVARALQKHGLNAVPLTADGREIWGAP